MRTCEYRLASNPTRLNSALYIFEFLQFSKHYGFQSSAAMFSTCGGDMQRSICSRVQQWNKYENRLIFREVINMSLFFYSQCRHNTKKWPHNVLRKHILMSQYSMNVTMSKHGHNTHWRTQRGSQGGSNPPIESSKKFVFCVCKIYSPSPALMFIKSKILYRKTLEIVR